MDCQKLQKKIDRLTRENTELKHMLFTRMPRLLGALERNNYFSEQAASFSRGDSNSNHVLRLGQPPSQPEGEDPMSTLNAHTLQEWKDFCPTSVRQSVLTIPNGEQVEIYPGSGVFVTRIAFINAQQRGFNSSSYVRALVQAVFPKAVLVRSNLRGGKSKIPVEVQQTHTSREKLDPVRMEAIYNAVLERFPDVKRGKLGMYVNMYICGLRYRTRKQLRS